MIALDLQETEIYESVESKTGVIPHARKVEPSFFNTPIQGAKLKSVIRTDRQVQRDRVALMAAWQDMTALERSYVVGDEIERFKAWLQRRNADLDRMIAAGMLDRPEDEIDVHRQETSQDIEFPEGVPVERPDLYGGQEQVLHVLYDAMAPLNEWVTAADLLALTTLENMNAVYSALNGLERRGVLVTGPSVVVESGRRMKQYAIERTTNFVEA